ncbi:PDR/VanB family oxidoreductase [Falsibacillus albus]|uniref:Oxidoreductase n=1 Tax=Falsibacillus albus TaxID=2478915 RepID=A0A3L7JSY7_9BACI|nr:PDR/VanB family oxidoreductase [Falsibacillus albus]RLQ93826.1 oxidoreductase [Falsibacillus albus]
MIYQDKTIKVLIKSIVQETANVKKFTLERAVGGHLPSFSGGSHITTYIDRDSVVLTRNYSLINHKNQESEYQIAVALADPSKGGSHYWHHHMKEGDFLTISYPKNHFSLSFKAKHHVFYAAGIGITPFLSMMGELKGKGSTFELHYAAKSRDQCAFYHEILYHYQQYSHFYFSRETNVKRLNADSLLDHPIGTHIYICGPEPFINSFRNGAEAIGYPKGSIHYERFTPELPKNPVPFKVRLQNRMIEVAKDKTLLDAMLEAGIQAPYSCRAGRCGTCEVKVLNGEVEHHDSFLSDEQKKAQDVMLTCVSRAKSGHLEIDF